MSLTKVTYSMISGSAINVVDLGADPSGTFDSASAIQAAIDSGASDIFLPAGKYLINSTLNFSSKKSVHFYGAAEGTNLTTPGTSIIANAAIGVMLNIYSSRDCIFERLVFNGNNKASIMGVKITSLNSVGNTTNLTFRNVNILLCNQCLQIGDGSINQTSEISFYQCTLQQSIYGVHHVGDNSTMINWYSSNILTDNLAYWISGGGAVNFHSCGLGVSTSGVDCIFVTSADSTNSPETRVVPRSINFFGCLTETPGYFLSTEDGPSPITGYPNCTQISVLGSNFWKPNNAAVFRLRTYFPAHLNIVSCTFDGPATAQIAAITSAGVQQVDVYGGTYMNAQVSPTPSDSIRIWGTETITYSSAWTATVSNPSIGNGSITSTYKIIGNTCTVKLTLFIGSTTTLGNGVWKFSVPFSAKSVQTFVGTAFSDASAYYVGNCLIGSYTADYNNVEILLGNATTAYNKATATTPIAWGANSYVYFEISYDIA